MMNASYRNLANAIVLSAVDDYKAAMRIINTELPEEANMWQRKNRETEVMLAEAEVKKIKNFFHSDWFIMLTGFQGGRIFAKMEKEYKHLRINTRK
jgi:hypothetical protein